MEEDYATLWKSKMDVWEIERAWDEERGELGGEREQVTVSSFFHVSQNL